MLTSNLSCCIFLYCKALAHVTFEENHFAFVLKALNNEVEIFLSLPINRIVFLQCANK